MEESESYEFESESERESTSHEEQPQVEGDEEVDLDKYPVGESPDAISSAVERGFEQGALSEVLSDYSPSEFNELIEKLSGEYKEIQWRKIKYRIFILFLSVVLVLALFGGLAWITMELGRDGGALIFFAGTLSGYFMRLATELT
ncbi:hypothetical protein [Natrinema ejinorense]|uniref:hypothetical protein n=1 Tax=Natrinema ejinorense TaxID=373386 RepID=UPI00117D2AD4|nr:hypothetical protein [Natrinema ejinorense]